MEKEAEARDSETAEIRDGAESQFVETNEQEERGLGWVRRLGNNENLGG